MIGNVSCKHLFPIHHTHLLLDQHLLHFNNFTLQMQIHMQTLQMEMEVYILADTVSATKVFHFNQAAEIMKITENH